MPTFEHADAKIAYQGQGAGPPVLFIQGVGVPGCGWRPQLEGLADRFHCVAFDHRGLGGSSPVEGRLDIADLVGDTLALMDHLGWADAHLVGHSMGGVIAHQLALDARSRVRSLSLLCTFARGKDAARLSPWVVWVGLRTRVGSRSMRRRAFLEIILPASQRRGADLEALAAHYGTFFGRDLAEQPPVVMKQLQALARHDDSARLPELAGLPTLVISGAEDRLALPIYGRALAGVIGGARYYQFAAAAHGVPIARPEQVNALLAEHLAAAEAGRP
jgi:pimeloyl-ACP methyl ester carboxylesterase